MVLWVIVPKLVLVGTSRLPFTPMNWKFTVPPSTNEVEAVPVLPNTPVVEKLTTVAAIAAALEPTTNRAASAPALSVVEKRFNIISIVLPKAHRCLASRTCPLFAAVPFPQRPYGRILCSWRLRPLPATLNRSPVYKTELPSPEQCCCQRTL